MAADLDFRACRARASIVDSFSDHGLDPEYDYKADRSSRDRKLDRHAAEEAGGSHRTA